MSAELEAAKAHVIGRLQAGSPGAEPAVESKAGAAGFTVVRATVPGARPGTGVAIALVSPGGRVLGNGIDDSLAGLVQELAPAAERADAQSLAELATVMTYDGMVAVLSDPPPSLVPDSDGLRLEATVRGAMARAADRLTIHIPKTGAPSLERRPVPKEPAPTPINRAAALERALAANDAMGLQSALRGMGGELDPREMVAVAKVALSVGGPIGTQARRRLGDGAAVEEALATAKAELGS